jgi:hypothetical protein
MTLLFEGASAGSKSLTFVIKNSSFLFEWSKLLYLWFWGDLGVK